MFWRKVDPQERGQVLDLLRRWQLAISEIDAATNAMRLTMAVQPTGMQSDEFEKARRAALTVLNRVQSQTSSEAFWPVLYDNDGAKALMEFRSKLAEAHGHQLIQLRKAGAAAEAFRRGRDEDAPSQREMTESNRGFAHILDQLGAIGGKLARRYRISPQEIQTEWRKKSQDD